MVSPLKTGGRPPRTIPKKKKWRGNDNASKGSFGILQRTSSGQNCGSHHKKSSNDSAATPSSVHVRQLPHGNDALTRDDMSDLSGSQYNHHHHSNSNSSVQLRQTVTPVTQVQWSHAKVLSTDRLPSHPQPWADDESFGVVRNAAVTVDAGEVVEVQVPSSKHNSANAAMGNRVPTTLRIPPESSSGGRTPLLLLLMDPSRKHYELMQLWMDPHGDSVRDVLQAVHRNLGEWRQDYDGLFRVRNNHFSQLIHVLKASQYPAVPYEVWVCKPWSMSAATTVSHASTLLNHLKDIGVLQYKRADTGHQSMWRQLVRGSSHASGSHRSIGRDDTVLTLSKKAKQRVYVPHGILKHHHACQFLAFTPPFEQQPQSQQHQHQQRVPNVLLDDGSVSATSALSDSHCADDTYPIESAQCASGGFVETNRSTDDGSTAETDSPGHSDVSLGTRASAYELRPAPVTHRLPTAYNSSHASHHTGDGTRLRQWLSALTCSKDRDVLAKHKAGTSAPPHKKSSSKPYTSSYATPRNAAIRPRSTRTQATHRTFFDDSSTGQLNPIQEDSTSSQHGHNHDLLWDSASQGSQAPLFAAHRAGVSDSDAL